MGLLIGSIGGAPATGEFRMTFGLGYLYDGIPLVVIGLGLFDRIANEAAVAEADIGLRRERLDRGHPLGRRQRLVGHVERHHHDRFAGPPAARTRTGGLPRATLNVTIAAPNRTIQGLYQIVNPDSGSISNHVMVRPGSN